MFIITVHQPVTDELLNINTIRPTVQTLVQRISIRRYRTDRWEGPFFIFMGSQNMQIHQNLAITVPPHMYYGYGKAK
jgi:hypothetical protein